MKKLICFFSAIICLIILSFSSSAADEAYLIGGGGASGQGTNDNGWLITSKDGGYIFEAEGLRIYLVSSKTGEPVAGKNVIDITNNDVATDNVINMVNAVTGEKITKYEYLKDKKDNKTSYKFDKSYTKNLRTTSPNIPLIIPWDGYPDSLSRISELKIWLLDKTVANDLCVLVGSDLETVKKEKWYLAIEPIAYFRYGGKDFAMTATECAVYNQVVGGWLYNRMNPLTHNNLPLSFFLDRTLFNTAAMPMEKWEKSKTANASDNDIINYLGIGYINYNSPTGDVEDEEEEEEEEEEVPDPEDVFIDFTIKAEPKEYEVKSDTPGVPVSIGKDATITIDLEQSDDNRMKWEKRLEKVISIEVTLKLSKSPIETGTSSLTCISNSKYNLTASAAKTFSLDKSQFIDLLKGELIFKDPCGSVLIKPGEKKRYDYEFFMSVKFIEAGEYTTKDNTITINALTPEGEKIGKDYSSFFRENDPPEYVTYTSNPVAYSEIKQGTIGNEQFEAMAGTPTTRDLYLGVGGSEFIVDFKAEYKKYNTAKRTYRVHYDETECEFKEADNSKTHTLGGITVNTHTGGSYVAAQTWSGNHSHSQNSANCGTCGATGYGACTINTSSYDSALAAATAYAAQINGTVLTWTAGSDKQTRTKSGWGASPFTTQNDTSSNARRANMTSWCTIRCWLIKSCLKEV